MAARRSIRQRVAPRAPGPRGVQLGEHMARGMILQGAAAVLAERGARAASIEQILKASGVSRRTLYRLYADKEDVMLGLYRIGSESLVDACRIAVSEESDPIRQVERCIDAHLRNARDLGRLVFVLGGEAQRRESLLHARRMEVHEQIASLLAPGAARVAPGGVDPLLVRGLLLALEGVTRMMLEEGDEGRRVADASLQRARRVMMRLATAALAGSGEGVAPLPSAEGRRA